MKKISLIKGKKYVIHAKKDLVLIMIIKSIIKSDIIVTTQENIEELLIVLRYKTSKEIPIVFHNGSIYDYHFIIEQLATEFKIKFNCLGENTEKYITFLAPINKKVDNDEIITYKLKFIDSFRFMLASLSSLVDNLSEIYKEEYKSCKKICQNIDLLILKVIDYTTSVKSVVMNHMNQ